MNLTELLLFRITKSTVNLKFMPTNRGGFWAIFTTQSRISRVYLIFNLIRSSSTVPRVNCDWLIDSSQYIISLVRSKEFPALARMINRIKNFRGMYFQNNTLAAVLQLPIICSTNSFWLNCTRNEFFDKNSNKNIRRRIKQNNIDLLLAAKAQVHYYTNPTHWISKRIPCLNRNEGNVENLLNEMK